MTILKNIISVAFVVSLLSGCADNFRMLRVMNEDQRAGIVNVGYTYKVSRRGEPPRDIIETTDKISTKRCQKWGYNEAKRLGGPKESCIGHSGWVNRTCSNYEVTVKYQCLSS
ncbi:YecR family lipoprotein [Neisseriaceae bacterium CLB008]